MTQPAFDIHIARSFLATIGLEGRNTFQTFAEAPGCRQPPAILHGPLERLAPALGGLDRRGCGVFVLINEGDGRGRKRANITRVRALFADFDGAPLPLRWPLEPHAIVRSSPGRYHAYWRVTGVPLGSFRELQRAIAACHGSDPGVSDLSRVMRLPGSTHRKATPVRVALVRLHPGEPYSLARVREAWPSVRSAARSHDHAMQAESSSGGGEAHRSEWDPRPVLGSTLRPAPWLDPESQTPMPTQDRHHPPRLPGSAGPSLRRDAPSPTLTSGGPSRLRRADRHGRAAAILERERTRVAGAVRGTRNTTLNRAAFRLGRLVGAGLLQRWSVAAALLAVALHAGLGAAEAIRTIRSGLDAGELFGSREDDPNTRPSSTCILRLGRSFPLLGGRGVRGGCALPRGAAAFLAHAAVTFHRPAGAAWR